MALKCAPTGHMPVHTIAPHSLLVSTQPLVWQDHSLGALGKDHQLSRQVPEIAVNKVLKASANNKHFLGGLHVRLDPVSKIRTIGNLSILGAISKISKM